MAYKCNMCGRDAEVGNMCQACMNGFNSPSAVRKAEVMQENMTMKNCSICGKLITDENGVCKECTFQYMPVIADFLKVHPDITEYTQLVFNKNLPIPRPVLWSLYSAKLIKVK